LVGKHVGERNFDQAQEYTWRGFEIVALYMTTLGISFVVFPSFYMNWFYNGQDELMWSQIQTVVPILLLFVALFALFDAVNLVLSFALKGAGDTHFVSQVVLVLPWPLMVIPTMFLVGVQHGLYWAWGAASLYIVTQAGFFLVRFIKGSWKSINMLQT